MKRLRPSFTSGLKLAAEWRQKFNARKSTLMLPLTSKRPEASCVLIGRVKTSILTTTQLNTILLRTRVMSQRKSVTKEWTRSTAFKTTLIRAVHKPGKELPASHKANSSTQLQKTNKRTRATPRLRWPHLLRSRNTTKRFPRLVELKMLFQRLRQLISLRPTPSRRT